MDKKPVVIDGKKAVYLAPDQPFILVGRPHPILDRGTCENQVEEEDPEGRPAQTDPRGGDEPGQRSL
jgi:hypothetical protein